MATPQRERSAAGQRHGKGAGARAPRPTRLKPLPRPGNLAARKVRAGVVQERLAVTYPEARCALVHDGPLQLLVATILSAQCTDERVNLVTPTLFKRYRSAAAYASANPLELEEIIQSTGFFRAKTRSIIGCAAALVEGFGGVVPARMEDLVTLPGVGRKTANVVLGVAFGLPGLAVDTHVTRLTRRLGLTRNSDPVKIEADVCAMLPPEYWSDFGLRLIEHGRRVCKASRPDCGQCVLNDICPSSLVIAPPADGAPPPRPGSPPAPR
ncbi:MAG: endonuclease III [Candidatus Dormibacteria bacterium]